MNANLHKIYAPFPLAAAFSHPVLNKNECIHHVVYIHHVIHSAFIPSSLFLSSHLSEKLPKARRESSAALITLNFSFFMMSDHPAELKRMKNQLAQNDVAYTFRPLGIAFRLRWNVASLDVKMVSLRFLITPIVRGRF